jgi:ketosteroid isomerase-like protein
MTTAREISDRYTEAVNAHDAEAIAALYEDGAALSDPTGEFTGREAIIGYWRTYSTPSPTSRPGTSTGTTSAIRP